MKITEKERFAAMAEKAGHGDLAKRIRDNIEFSKFWKQIPKPGTIALISIDEMEKFARNVWMEARK
jgi:hypothetical protein